jgi:MFS family permease
MGFSYFALGTTREPVDNEKVIPEHLPSPWKGGMDILRRDRNFTAFLIIRVLTQFATMGFAFYIVYGLRQFGMSDLVAGFLTAALTLTSTISSALMGWLGDRLGHRTMLIAGGLAAVLSSILAWMAPTLGWLYPVFILSGLAGTAYWTSGMSFTVEFGTEETRPTYIGLSNTLVAPFSIIAPLIGGIIAQTYGFQTTFMVCAAAGVVVSVLLFLFVRDPRPRRAARLLDIETQAESEPSPNL